MGTQKKIVRPHNKAWFLSYTETTEPPIEVVTIHHGKVETYEELGTGQEELEQFPNENSMSARYKALTGNDIPED